MPYKNFVDGSLLTAADVNRYWLQQVHIFKTVDEQVVNSAVLQDDDELVLPLLANTDYWLECFIKYGAHTTMDFRVMVSVPAGTTIDLLHNGLITSHATGDGIDAVSRARMQVGSSGGTPGGRDASNTPTLICPLEGRVIVAGTAGNITLRWAQSTAAAGSGTVVRAGSVMILQRLTE